MTVFTPAPSKTEIVWTTKEGQALTMREISNGHLINIIKLLIRKSLEHLSSGYEAMSYFRGEMAMEAAQSSIDIEYEAYLDEIEKFRAEARRRQINERDIP